MLSGSGLSESPVLEYCISAAYGGRSVLRDVRGSIAAGEIVSLVGLSGSGKSTLALALLGLLEYRGGSVSGSIRLAGRELMGLGAGALRDVRGRLMAYVPQSPAAALNPKLRVSTLLQETWRAHRSGQMPEPECAALLDAVQLPQDEGFRSQRAGELSAGQGQRLLIALAILHKPALLIADEPTSALDAITQAAVLRLLTNLTAERRMATLFISHDLLSVAAMSSRVEILHCGEIVETGTPEEIFRRPRHVFTKELVAAMPQNFAAQ
jgi:ABC-type glutathione transport system ATPase component